MVKVRALGEIMASALREMKVPVVPALSDIRKTILIRKDAGFKINDVAQQQLPKIANNQLCSLIASAQEINTKPLNIGFFYSGGPASGGHNVAAGLFDAVTKMNPESKVIGFFNGPDGLLSGNGKILSEEDIYNVRNQGGFYLRGTSRTKFEKKEQMKKCLEATEKFDLDGLLVIGGDDSNTNAAHLANYLKIQGSKTTVVGIPKTIDGDLAFLPYLQTSFGFYTAAMTYSEMVGNITGDLPSSRKIWHFVKLMGRSASHITLETALQTHPNVALIGEEIKEKKMTLAQVIDNICDVVAKRHKDGKKYGLVLIPEGIVGFIPEMESLISAINESVVKMGEHVFTEMHVHARREFICAELAGENLKVFNEIPSDVQHGLLSDLDPHGNVQVSQIASDVLIMELVKQKMAKEGIKLTTQNHFYGYDGRCGYPTWFDATYTYNLGLAASVMVANKETGYMVSINDLAKGVEDWKVWALPLAGMMSVENRKGKEVLVIEKYLVNLNSKAFKEFEKNRDNWAINDDYINPGPIQYWGPDEIVKAKAITMTLNSEK